MTVTPGRAVGTSGRAPHHHLRASSRHQCGAACEPPEVDCGICGRGHCGWCCSRVRAGGPRGRTTRSEVGRQTFVVPPRSSAGRQKLPGRDRAQTTGNSTVKAAPPPGAGAYDAVPPCASARSAPRGTQAGAGRQGTLGAERTRGRAGRGSRRAPVAVVDDVERDQVPPAAPVPRSAGGRTCARWSRLLNICSTRRGSAQTSRSSVTSSASYRPARTAAASRLRGTSAGSMRSVPRWACAVVSRSVVSRRDAGLPGHRAGQLEATSWSRSSSGPVEVSAAPQIGDRPADLVGRGGDGAAHARRRRPSSGPGRAAATRRRGAGSPHRPQAHRSRRRRSCRGRRGARETNAASSSDARPSRLPGATRAPRSARAVAFASARAARPRRPARPGPPGRARRSHRAEQARRARQARLPARSRGRTDLTEPLRGCAATGAGPRPRRASATGRRRPPRRRALLR